MSFSSLVCLIVLVLVVRVESTTFLKGAGYSKLLRKASIAVISAGITVDASVLSSYADDSPKVQIFGLNKGRLLSCKTKSNCFSSSSVNSLEHYGRPWSFDKDPDEEFKEIAKVVKSTEFPLKLAEEDAEKRYIRLEAKSAVPPTGIDDIEFLINPIDKIITYRTNSREFIDLVGDVGSHKNRLESIKRKLGVSEMAMSSEAEEYLQTEQKMGFFQKMQAASQPSAINFVDNSVGTEGSSSSP